MWGRKWWKGGGDGGVLGEGGAVVRATRRSRTESSFWLRSVLAWERVAWCWVSLWIASSRRSRDMFDGYYVLAWRQVGPNY